MARKTTVSSRKTTSAPTAESAGRNEAKHQAGRATGKTPKRTVVPHKSATVTAKSLSPPVVTRPLPIGKTAAPHSAELLDKGEANLAAAIESLTNRMNSALAALTDLAVTQRAGEDYVRTAPLDRAAAMFQRLVGEVVDDHLSEMLPTLVALRSEMATNALPVSGSRLPPNEFLRRGTEMLDQVLAGAKVNRYDARPGEAFDPLIHLAVGETHRQDMPNGAVAEFLEPGFRTARGRVIAPAKVKVNRR
jgi:molecular chaperone GrpE (heat shock protein)